MKIQFFMSTFLFSINIEIIILCCEEQHMTATEFTFMYIKREVNDR